MSARELKSVSTSARAYRVSTLLRFIATGIAWGSGFLFIRIAVTGMSPVQFVFARTLLAAVVLTGVMLVIRARWPRGWVAWRRIFTLGVIGVLVPLLLYAWAGQRIPSGLSSIYNSAVPIATALITLVALRQETLGARKLGAIGLGGVGIVIVLAPWELGRSAIDLWGQLACLGAVLAFGFAFAYTRKAITPLGLDPLAVSTGQMLVSAAVMACVLPAVGGGELSLSPVVVLSVVVIGVVGTGFAYVWNFTVIERWGAASASMVTYVATVVGVVLGIVVMNESLTPHHIVGAVVVLAGVALGVGPLTPRATARGETPRLR